MTILFIFVTHLLILSTIEKIVAFTVERFLAICGSSKNIPPTQNIGGKLSRTKKIAFRNIALIWAISLCGAAPLVTLTRINYLELDHQKLLDSAWCGMAYNEPDKRWEFYLLSSTVIFFLIPLMLISFLYFKIASKLKKATRLDSYSNMQLTDQMTSRKIVQSRKIVIRMLGEHALSFLSLSSHSI